MPWDDTESSTRPTDGGDGSSTAARVERVLRGRNRTKADVVLATEGGRAVAIKDYAPRPWIVRATLGRWSIAREARAYRALAGIAGVPELIGRRGPYALVIARAPGRTLADLGERGVAAEVFDRLDDILAAIHARGVALGDLHHRDVLVAADGTVHVVDLATAWVRGSAPWSRALFERLRDNDLVSAARLRARFTGGDERAALLAAGPRAASWRRRGRAIRAALDRARGRRSR